MFAPGSCRWYDIFTNTAMKADVRNRISIDLTWDNFGFFVKEGSIVPTFSVGDQSIKSTEELRDGRSKYDINVYLDERKQAQGFLYIDDGKTLEYQKKVRD